MEIETGKIYKSDTVPGEIQKDKGGTLWQKDLLGRIWKIQIEDIGKLTFLRNCEKS